MDRNEIITMLAQLSIGSEIAAEQDPQQREHCERMATALRGAIYLLKGNKWRDFGFFLLGGGCASLVASVATLAINFAIRHLGG